MKRLGGKREAGVPGYGVRDPGVWCPGMWKTRGCGGKHGVSVENTCHLIGDSNEYKFIYVPSTISSESFF